jgi:hypothetical protein
MEFLQQVCAFFSYIREKLFRWGTHYVPVSGNELDVERGGGACEDYDPFFFGFAKHSKKENENENQYTIMFDAENGMMYNKL